MSHLEGLIAHRLFRRERRIDGARQIIVWWEKRRLWFNLIVGLAGAMSLGLFSALVLCTNGRSSGWCGYPPPIFIAAQILFYGVAANVFYTGGWIAEILVLRTWKEKGEWFFQIAFTLGLLFSIALTLLPGLVSVVALLACFFLRK